MESNLRFVEKVPSLKVARDSCLARTAVLINGLTIIIPVLNFTQFPVIYQCIC